MKKVLLGLSLLILTCGTVNLRAQNIVNADDENNLSNFYKRTISTTKSALPYPHLRESDVIWETCIWRTIDSSTTVYCVSIFSIPSWLRRMSSTRS